MTPKFLIPTTNNYLTTTLGCIISFECRCKSGCYVVVNGWRINNEDGLEWKRQNLIRKI